MKATAGATTLAAMLVVRVARIRPAGRVVGAAQVRRGSDGSRGRGSDVRERAV